MMKSARAWPHNGSAVSANSVLRLRARGETISTSFLLAVPGTVIINNTQSSSNCGSESFQAGFAAFLPQLQAAAGIPLAGFVVNRI